MHPATDTLDTSPHYWCVVCGRLLFGDEALGAFIHDDIPHPVLMTYDEETRPQ